MLHLTKLWSNFEGELGEIHEETDAHNGRENAIIDGELSSGVQLKMFGVHTK